MADSGEEDSQSRIREGDHVVLKRGEVFKAVQVQPKKKVVFEKKWIFLDKAVGELYSTTFEMLPGGNLEPQKPKNTETSTDTKEAGTDNRNIVDDGKSQKLTRDDIETLKGQGLKGQEIIQQLIDNSATFRDKTRFAQAKYINKKNKKYENTITILKPSCRILALMYHGREPGKICHMRYDTLAQMLTLGNIHAGSKILVFDTCAGLVLGAVMERMGGHGSVIQMYPGGGPMRAGVESFGFPAHFHEALHEFPICHVNALLEGRLEATLDTSAETSRSKQTEEKDRTDAPEEQNMETSSSADPDPVPDPDLVPGPVPDPDPDPVPVPDPEPVPDQRGENEKRKEIKAQEKKLRMEEKRKKLVSAAALLEGRNADGLIIASRFHPCPVLLGLIKFLAPSRPFVVYSQYKEPLIECYTKLKEQGGTVNLRLSDSWLRHYQVLPNRTHPVLLMSGGGGFILSGITVTGAVADHASRPASSRKAGEPAPKRLKLTGSEG